MSIRRVLWSCLLLQLVASPAAVAIDLVPFRARNLSPVALVQTLVTAEPARLLRPGRSRVHAEIDLASHAMLSSAGSEQIRLDGETVVGTLGLRHGLGEQLQVGLDAHWVGHDAGFLDGFISGWHDFFGLPDGDRPQLPEDQLAFRYQRDADLLLDLDRPTDGPGDLSLLLAWQLAADEMKATAVHASVKLPTGEADSLTGSEGWGGSLALAHERNWSYGERSALACWAGIGALWLGDGEVLAAYAEDFAAYGWLGGGWSPIEPLAFKLQFDTRTALYDSGLDELGSSALLLSMGGTLALGERTSLEIFVGEDLAVHTAPDVSFHLGLAHTF